MCIRDSINIVAYCADMEEAQQMLKDRLAYGIIYIPSEFSQDIAPVSYTHLFVFSFISVPAKWIMTARQYVLNIYTENRAYARPVSYTHLLSHIRLYF